jgi:hypothetical protein
VTQYRTVQRTAAYFFHAMADRPPHTNDRKPGALAGGTGVATPRITEPATATAATPRRVEPSRPVTAMEANPRRPASKFGAATDGWDAYNSWLDRVRQPATPPSRQAVIAKALYSVSSYKNWADKARGAFDAGTSVPGGPAKAK